jgi:nitroreductase
MLDRSFQRRLIKEALNTPPNIRPVAIIPVGHATEKPTTPQRRAFKEIVHYETF